MAKIEPPRDFLVRKGGYFYRPNAQGYTANPAEAGRFTFSEAWDYSHPNGEDGPRDGITFIHESEVDDPTQDALAARDAEVKALREALADGLAKYDEVVKACPANKTFLGDRLCPKCGASSQEGCREENRAAFSFISNTRAAL